MLREAAGEKPTKERLRESGAKSGGAGAVARTEPNLPYLVLQVHAALPPEQGVQQNEAVY